MTERDVIYLPGVPRTATGVAQMIPGASTRQARPVDFGHVEIQKRAPNLMESATGVLQDGTALAAADLNDSIGSGLTEIGERINRSYETAQLAMAEVSMKQAEGEFRAHLPTNPDEWSGQWDKASEKVRATVLDPKKLTPRLQQKLQLNYTAWDAGVRNGLEAQALTHKRALTSRMLSFAEGEAAEAEDMQRLEGVIMARVDAGDISPEEGSMRLSSYNRKFQMAKDYREARNDPFAAEVALQNGYYDNWDPDDKVKIGKVIEQEKERTLTREAHGITAALEADPNMPAEQFKALVNQTHFSAEQKQAALRNYRDEGGEPDWNYLTRVGAEIDRFTPDAKEKDVMVKARDILLNVPKPYRNQMLARLETRVNRQKDTLLGLAMDKIDARIARAIELEDSSLMLEGGTTADPVKKEQARTALFKHFQAWREVNPKATDTDIDAWLDQVGLPKTPATIAEEEAQKREADNAKIFRQPGEQDLPPYLKRIGEIYSSLPQGFYQ